MLSSKRALRIKCFFNILDRIDMKLSGPHPNFLMTRDPRQEFYFIFHVCFLRQCMCVRLCVKIFSVPLPRVLLITYRGLNDL